MEFSALDNLELLKEAQKLHENNEFKKCIELCIANENFIDEEHKLSFLIIQMYCNHYLENHEKTLELTEKIYDIDSLNNDNNWVKIYTLLKLKKYDECITFLTKMTENSENSENKGEIYKYIGTCYYNLENYIQAMDFFSKAIKEGYDDETLSTMSNMCLLFQLNVLENLDLEIEEENKKEYFEESKENLQ